MNRYLVTVESKDGVVAGIYVEAVSRAAACAQVREFLGACELIAWRR